MEIPVGVVLYNPDIERLRQNINAIYEDAAHVILVDNGSKNIADIEKVLNEFPGTQLMKNDQNEGIAKALNQLCERALQEGYNHIVTLDQDSVCPTGMIRKYTKWKNKKEIGIVCPIIRDRNHELGKTRFEEKYSEVDHCITSGSMVLLDAWKKVNGFDESMFIDGVDFDFCLRIRKHHYKIIRDNTVVLLHEIGHIQVRSFFIWKVQVKNHSPFRKYYIARNTIYLARKKRKCLLIIKSYLQVLKQAAIVLLYEKEKKEKICKIYQGTKEGGSVPIDCFWSL